MSFNADAYLILFPWMAGINWGHVGNISKKRYGRYNDYMTSAKMQNDSNEKKLIHFEGYEAY